MLATMMVVSVLVLLGWKTGDLDSTDALIIMAIFGFVLFWWYYATEIVLSYNKRR
jgi:hypothetical protein